MKKKLLLLVFSSILLLAPAAFAAMATFDDLTLAPNSHWGGAGSGETGFTNGDAYFPHTSGSNSWSGFVYSNINNTATAGYTNQFAAYTGTDVSGSGNYALSYIPLDWKGGTYKPIPQTASFGAVTGEDYNSTISGAYFTNTTYAYLSMSTGDQFAKKFGGTSGDDPDWFKLIIKGIDNGGNYTGTVDFYLADFRFADNSKDYIVDKWTWVDLTGLGKVVGLEFSLASSDNSAYGMNTPAYFAMDNLNAVPIPGAVWLLGSGLIGLIGIRKKVIN